MTTAEFRTVDCNRTQARQSWNDENSHVIEYAKDSNPEFTSSVIIAYARAAYHEPGRTEWLQDGI